MAELISCFFYLLLLLGISFSLNLSPVLLNFLLLIASSCSGALHVLEFLTGQTVFASSALLHLRCLPGQTLSPLSTLPPLLICVGSSS